MKQPTSSTIEKRRLGQAKSLKYSENTYPANNLMQMCGDCPRIDQASLDVSMRSDHNQVGCLRIQTLSNELGAWETEEGMCVWRNKCECEEGSPLHG